MRAFGDDPVDGYVCWARHEGFPWWPCQLITLVGMNPRTMKQIVAQVIAISPALNASVCS